MKMIEIIKSSLATLRMNGRRTFLTMIGIIIGIAAVITILSLGNGFKKQTLDELAQDAKGRPSQSYNFNQTNYEIDWLKLDPFSKKTMEAIEEIEGVDEVKGQSEDMVSIFYSSIKYGNSPRQDFAIDHQEFTDNTMLVGRNLMLEDSKAAKRYIVIDEFVAMSLFNDIEKALHKSLEIDATTYTIVGVFQMNMSPEDMDQMKYGYFPDMKPQIVIPKGTQELLNPMPNIEFGVTVYFEPGVDLKQAVRRVGNYLKENGPEKENGEYNYYDNSEMMESIGNQLNMITYFIGSVAGISLFIAGVGVMNMMYISVSERTREIGIRRSLGATQKSIQWQFLLEGISITTLGGLIGYGLGVIIANVASQFLPFKALIDIPTALISVFISVMIGIIFSVFPARAAASKNVVDILR